MPQTSSIVLVLGSGPNAPDALDYPAGLFDSVVAINNAWRVRPDWTHHIFPDDFPPDRRAPALTSDQREVTAAEFVPAQNAYGGFVYAGGTMAFTAAYWALAALRPAVLAFIGCDMVYPARGPTHFYGTGTADPLRPDITLQDLSAKSARLEVIAARQGCHCVNLSRNESRLVFGRARPGDLRRIARSTVGAAPLTEADRHEALLGYSVPSGRYWEDADRFDAAALAEIDRLWLKALAAQGRAAVA